VIDLYEHLKILYVEDSENDTILMNHMLKDICQNIHYERIDSKEDLIERIKGEKWDMIIIDNALPQFTALEAIEIIKEFKVKVPMICVSGSEMFDVKDKCLDAGADAFLLKDDSETFVKTVEEILQRCFG
jgi:CheY-like chemotaxis protein